MILSLFRLWSNIHINILKRVLHLRRCVSVSHTHALVTHICKSRNLHNYFTRFCTVQMGGVIKASPANEGKITHIIVSGLYFKTRIHAFMFMSGLKWLGRMEKYLKLRTINKKWPVKGNYIESREHIYRY